MTNRRFDSLGLLNVHKELTDKLDLAEVGNEFISLNEEQISSQALLSITQCEWCCTLY